MQLKYAKEVVSANDRCIHSAADFKSSGLCRDVVDTCHPGQPEGILQLQCPACLINDNQEDVYAQIIIIVLTGQRLDTRHSGGSIR